ncbi:hypothetical protein [uncultured Aquimarina sp.]|uniref:hypothetical protein n=1 Tax=uncultured Aquimarina sp. TaxID=575652 RepID=UPI0026313371|nr:hypothetical protein [uncultured Aquimarina sp.]
MLHWTGVDKDNHLKKNIKNRILKFNKPMKKHIDFLNDILNNELDKLKESLFSKKLPIQISKEEKERLENSSMELDHYQSHVLGCKWESEKLFKERIIEYANKANDQDFSKRLAIQFINITLLFNRRAEEEINLYWSSNPKKIEVVD